MRPPFTFTFESFLQARFVLLGERPPEEIALGVVGRFWSPAGGVLPMDAERFRSFTQPGFAKAVWNFSIEESDPGISRLRTETRVQCLDPASQRRFRLYWLFVRPFSGLIRREALKLIKRRAESAGEAAQGPQAMRP